MTRVINVTCDRCGATGVGKDRVGGPGTAAPHGWRYVPRDIDLCPDCSERLTAWVLRRPQPPTPGDQPAGSDHLLDVDADGRITADDDVPTRMPARQVAS